MKRMAIFALFASLVATASATAAEKDAEKGFFGDVMYSVSFGLGGGVPLSDDFDGGFGTGFGAVLDVGVRKSFVELAADFDYGFYFNSTVEPLDANTFNAFLMLKIKPFGGAVRPYALVGAGIYRFWIVDADFYETALGGAAGGGIEAEISDTQHLFIEGKYVAGRTREANPLKANTESVVGRVGVSWVIE